MQGGRNLSKLLQIVIQTLKIKLFRVTAGVCAESEIARISNKIQQYLGMIFMSKNTRFSKFVDITASFIRLN